MAHRIPEGLGGLARQGAPGGVGNGAGDHYRQALAGLVEDLFEGVDRRLGVQGVEDGLDHDQIGAAFDQCQGCLAVVVTQGIEGHVALGRVIDVRRQRGGTRGRSKHAGHVAGHPGLFADVVAYLAGQPSGFAIELRDQLLHAVVRL